MGRVGAYAANSMGFEPFPRLSNGSDAQGKRNPFSTTETRSLLLIRLLQSGERLIFSLDECRDISLRSSVSSKARSLLQAGRVAPSTIAASVKYESTAVATLQGQDH
jgi:hypothetical protein